MLDAEVIVDAGEELETVDATDGGPRGRSVLHDEQSFLAVNIEVPLLGVAELIILDDAVDLSVEPAGEWRREVVVSGRCFRTHQWHPVFIHRTTRSK